MEFYKAELEVALSAVGIFGLYGLTGATGGMAESSPGSLSGGRPGAWCQVSSKHNK